MSKSGAGINWELLTRTLRPENSPGFLLWQVANQWQRRQRAALDPIGITHVQFILLAGLGYLQQKHGLVIQSRLAQFCKTDAMMTSQVLRTLEREDLVVRTRHPSDQRAKSLMLTDHGVAVLNKAMPVVLACDGQVFGILGEAGSKSLVESLRAMWSAHADVGEDGAAAADMR